MSSPNLSDADFHPHIIDVFDYADSVVSGAKLSCEAEQLACKRFFTDLDRDFDYHFDHEKAVRAINFIEKLPHVKGQWAAKRLRITLQPWQKFIVAMIFGWVHKVTGFR
jgi:phage terminase large subunit-like protein